MRLEEDWAVSRVRICSFFQEQPDVEQVPEGFVFGSCRITLRARQGQAGPFPVARTVVCMEGGEADVRTIHQRFFLRFLSAGG